MHRDAATRRMEEGGRRRRSPSPSPPLDSVDDFRPAGGGTGPAAAATPSPSHRGAGGTEHPTDEPQLSSLFSPISHGRKGRRGGNAGFAGAQDAGPGPTRGGEHASSSPPSEPSPPPPPPPPPRRPVPPPLEFGIGGPSPAAVVVVGGAGDDDDGRGCHPPSSSLPSSLLHRRGPGAGGSNGGGDNTSRRHPLHTRHLSMEDMTPPTSSSFDAGCVGVGGGSGGVRRRGASPLKSSWTPSPSSLANSNMAPPHSPSGRIVVTRWRVAAWTAAVVVSLYLSLLASLTYRLHWHPGGDGNGSASRAPPGFDRDDAARRDGRKFFFHQGYQKHSGGRRASADERAAAAPPADPWRRRRQQESRPPLEGPKLAGWVMGEAELAQSVGRGRAESRGIRTRPPPLPKLDGASDAYSSSPYLLNHMDDAGWETMLVESSSSVAAGPLDVAGAGAGFKEGDGQLRGGSDPLPDLEAALRDNLARAAEGGEVDGEGLVIPPLCGAQALAAADHRPHLYSAPERRLSSESTVVITGIFSNPIGVHLALALRGRCNVTSIVGIDSLWPNTVSHRLRVQSQMSVLTRAVPKFRFELPWIGVHPKPSGITLRKLRREGKPMPREFDIMRMHGGVGATHVVHLMGVDPSPYYRGSGGGPGEPTPADDRDGAPPRLEDDSTTTAGARRPRDFDPDPSSTDAAASWWSPYGPDRPMNAVRQGLVGMEQILGSVARHRERQLEKMWSKEDDKAEEKAGGNPPAAEVSLPVGARDVPGPSLVYASTLDVHLPGGGDTAAVRDPEGPQPRVAEARPIRADDATSFAAATRILDEILASAYARTRGVQSVGLRLGLVYGPWDHFSSGVDRMARRAVGDRGASIVVSGRGDDPRIGPDDIADFLFVDDAVDAILAAMQMRPTCGGVAGASAAGAAVDTGCDGTASVFNVGTGRSSTLRMLGQMMEEALPRTGNDSEVEVGVDAARDVSGGGASQIPPAIVTPLTSLDVDAAQKILGWHPRTGVEHGVPKLLAWHHERAFPFGSPPEHLVPASEEGSTGENGPAAPDRDDPDGRGMAIARAHGVASCAGDGTTITVPPPALGVSPASAECPRGTVVLPCASECAFTAASCSPTVFDAVVEVARAATEGCRIVLYTVALGGGDGDVTSMPHRLSPKDEALNAENAKLGVCNIAFIPRRSKLAEDIVRSIPASAIAELDGKSQEQEEGHVLTQSEIDSRLDTFNGQVDADGWTAVWVPSQSSTSEGHDDVKPLSTAELFLLKLAPGRLFAPTVQYAMYVERNFPVSPTQDDVLFLVSESTRDTLSERTVTFKEEDGTKRKYKLPSEPRRRSIMLAAPMRKHPKVHRVTPYMATKIMMAELGGGADDTEKAEVTVQRTFYERIPALIHKEDSRSIYEPLYRFNMEPFWIRSRWLIHDLSLEEGRQLRCEWYSEHVRWENDLDQLSFAHVMARRELERNVERREMDHRARAKLPTYPEELTDRQDWHAVLTRDGRWTMDDDDGEETAMINHVPDHLVDDEGLEEHEDLTEGKQGGRVHLYVRIMSDREMMKSRKKWIDKKKEKAATSAATTSTKKEVAAGNKLDKKWKALKERVRDIGGTTRGHRMRRG